MRFSQSRMYKKRALYRPSIKKARAEQKKPEQKSDSRMIKKEIGGEKNGGHRIVRKNRLVGVKCLLPKLEGRGPGKLILGVNCT